MKKIAVIPARAGSKRIPKKNIMDFCGKPMIAWTIEAALESEIFDCIYVDTDGEEIAEVSKKFGATVPFLRDNYLDDISPISEATTYFLRRLKEGGEEVDTVFQLMANCPLRDATVIRDFDKFYDDHDYPFVLSCMDYGWQNPWWAHKITEAGAKPLFEKEIKQRSQDLSQLFCPTGAIWVGNSSSLMEANSFYGKGYQFHQMDWKYAVDIDNYDDYEMAVVLRNFLQRKSKMGD